MIETLPLRIGHKYTIYSYDDRVAKPRKREIVFTGNRPEYLVHEGRKRACIGQFVSKRTSQDLNLIINYTRDLIIPGWGHPNLHQQYAHQVVFDATFEQLFCQYLQNINKNFGGEKNLHFRKEYMDSKPVQAFPLTTPKSKAHLQNC